MKQINTISKIKSKWKLLVWLKMICGWFIMIAIGYVSFFGDLSVHWQVLIAISTLVVSFVLFRNQIPSKSEVYQLVNAQIPNMEYSVSLIETEETYGLAGIQKQRANESLLSSSKNIRYPLKWHQLFWVFLICAALGSCIRLIHPARDQVAREQPDLNQSEVALEITPESPTRYTAKARINPPKYSGLSVRHEQNLNLSDVLKGSTIIWQLNFNKEPKSAWIQFSNGDSLGFNPSDTHYKVSIKSVTRGFYSINFIDQKGKQHHSDYYKLNVIPDDPPEIKISGIPQYQSILPGEANGTKFTVSIIDAFGISDAYLIATITKGSGESVKFREEKIPFRQRVSGRSFNETVRFTIEQFGMEPGNELYFYAEAIDNQTPPQSSRTETFFFVLEDTAEYAFSLEGTLGVDLMPEYFRSQRQIIIDSEKLLAEKSAISRQEFNQRSNELGFDQKALRLKYGQFMGEEADSGLDIENEVETPESGPDTGEPGQVDVLSEFGHDHDHENEEGQLMDKGTEQFEDPVEALSHSHDDTDQATFFGETMKDKLRAALNEMWDAELYLRLFKPEESLPYQYKALKLIKEIKNHARIYVHRMGFDAPPIKEAESRLTGDLDHVHGEQFETSTSYEEHFAQTKLLIQAIAEKEKTAFPQKNTLRSQLQAAGNELAGKAIEEPRKYLTILSLIRAISDQEELSQKSLVGLKLHLLKVLNDANQIPTLDDYPTHELLDLFIQELNKSNP